jgi:hypothetical protein
MSHSKFDTKAFLSERWSNSAKLHHWLDDFGMADVTEPAVRKWIDRKSIPAEHFAIILALLEIENGRPMSIAKFLR